MNVLFICSRNRLRSPTAEQVFADYPGLATASAGLEADAAEPLTPELLKWAEIIFLMEKSHRNKLARKFRAQLKNQRVICLDIPDEYAFMDPRLVEILKEVVPRHLRLGRPGLKTTRHRP
jgi:predicted protein tyrosine phosphatase